MFSKLWRAGLRSRACAKLRRHSLIGLGYRLKADSAACRCQKYTSHVRGRPGSADLMRGSSQLLRALVVGQVKVAANLVRLALKDNRVLDSEDTRKGWLAILIANLAEKVLF